MAVGLSLAEYHLRLAASPSLLQARLLELSLDVVDQLETVGRHLAEQRLTTRSRSLLTSIRADAVASDDFSILITFAMGGDYEGLRIRYGRLQERGGTVVPKKAKSLAIPVGPALTGPGIPKYPSAKLAPYLVMVKKTRSGLMVIGRDGAVDDPESIISKITEDIKAPVLVHRLTGQVWYLLLRQTTIPAHWIMRDAAKMVNDEVPHELARVSADLLQTLSASGSAA